MFFWLEHISSSRLEILLDINFYTFFDTSYFGNKFSICILLVDGDMLVAEFFTKSTMGAEVLAHLSVPLCAISEMLSLVADCNF